MARFANRSLWTVKTLLQRLGPTALIFTLLIVIFAGLFSVVQGASVLDSFYWSIVTGFTVGFGDVLPTIMVSKLLTMAYIPLVSITYLVLGAHIVGVVIEARNEFTHEEQQKMFDDLLEMRCELQAVINHFDIEVDYSEDGGK